MEIKHRIADVAVKGSAVVHTVSKILRLLHRLGGFSMTGVNRDQALWLWRAQATGILMIDDDAPCENHFSALFRNRDGELVQCRVGADSMAPAHVPD